MSSTLILARPAPSHELLGMVDAYAARGDLAAVLQVGTAILDDVFAGSLDALRAGRGRTTLRALAKASGGRTSASTLYRYVAVAALCRRLGRADFQHLRVSHLRQVLPLSDELQETLILRAERERWTVRKLRNVVRDSRSEAERVVGRPPSGGYRRALGHLRAWLRDQRRFDGLEGEQLVEASDIEAQLRLIRKVRLDLDMIESRLRSSSW